jgi:tetratricopeptide (TPR) repeat protein
MTVLGKTLGANRLISRFSALLLLLGLSSMASGCQFWRNFSSYFNTLYLAEQHLSIYEDEIGNPPPAPTPAVAMQQRRWLDEEYETRLIAKRNGVEMKITPTFVRTKAGAAPRQTGNTMHLDSAIILGSKILAKKDVKYVEDALFVIGKAMYYKNDFTGSKRKFLELLSKYPETEYAIEAHTSLARSMIALGRIDSANVAIESAMLAAAKSDNDETVAAAMRAYAEFLYLKNSDSLTAIRETLLRAEQNLDGHEGAQMAYESGAIAYMEGKWSEAEAAFARAVDKGEQDYFVGEAKIAQALAMRRQGRFAEAKKILEEVGEKNVYLLSRPAAKYEFALTEEMESRMAVNDDLRSSQFTSSALPRIRNAYFIVDTSFKNESQAVLSRSKFRQAELYRAMAQYDSASKLATSLIGTKDFSTPTYNEYVSEKMRSLAKFSLWKKEISTADTVLDVIREIRSGSFDARKQEAQLRMEATREVLGDRWRPDVRIELTKEDSTKLESKIAERRTSSGVRAAKFNIGDTSRFIDSVNLRRANAYYELGRAYENFSEIPNARTHYLTALDHKFIIADTGKEAFKAMVFYAWLQLEHRERNIATRDSILQVLSTRYGQTMYAEQAMNLFGAQADPNSPAEQAYRSAYGTLQRSGIDAGKSSLVSVRHQYKNEDVAPRSLYAIGLTYEDMTRYDSALVYYKEIMTEYPYSVYAEALRPRMADVAVAKPRRTTARRVESVEPKSDNELQQEEADRVRRQREEELKKLEQETPRPFGGEQPIDEQPQPSGLPDGRVPGVEAPSSPFK